MNSLQVGKMLRLILFGLMLIPMIGLRAQTFSIGGTVRSALDQKPLAGVSIQIKGTTIGVVTDDNGAFTVSGATVGETLLISNVGFHSLELKIQDQKSLNILLEQSDAELNEIIVTGYRAQSRGSITGSVTSVNASALKDAPYDNLSNALSGRLAGVTVTQEAGSPGIGSTIRVRAQGTFNNVDPLYVIDGVVSDKFTFDGLSTSDIENVTVLKDGASAAIYGSRAANGVVLVTTRRGKNGAPTLNYNGIYGFQNVVKMPATLNAYQQATAVNDQLNYNKTPTTDGKYYTQDELDYFKTHSYNWIDALWVKPYTTQHTLDLSGGNQSVKYFLGGSYNYAGGSFNNLNYQKLGIRGNVDVTVTKNLTVSLDLSANRRLSNGPSWQIGNDRQEDLYKALLIRTAMVPPYINGQPVGNWVEWHPGVVTTPDLSGYNKEEWSELNSILTINYKLPFIKGMSVKAYLNGYKRDIYTKQFNLPYDMVLFNTTGGHHHIVGDTAVGLRHRAADEFLQSRYDKIERYQFDAQINYKRSFGKHNIDALLVYEQAGGDDVWFNGRRDNFISTSIDQYIAASPVDPHVDGRQDQSARLSYVGQASYDYDHTYMLEASFRYDGSIVFSPQRRWGFFPSVSAGWKISNEKFFKDHVSFINDLKLRASAALVGNDDVGNFQWQQSYNIVDGAIFGDQTNGLEPGTLANTDITWEKSLSYNAGLDSRFLNNFNFSLDLFYRHTYDILGSRQLSIPSTFGAPMPDENYQRVDSRGFELSLGYNNQVGAGKNAVAYHVQGNFSFAKNKVLRLDQAENIRAYKSKIGLPIDPIFGYVATGIIRTQADLDALPEGYTIIGVPAQLGMLNYKDIRGPNSDEPDGRITDDDQEYIGKYSQPPYNFGLSLGVTWRSFSLDMLVQGVAGGKDMLPNAGRDIQARAEESSFAYWADSWTPDNPNGSYPGYRGTGYRTRYPASTFWLMDDSFVRLKNLNVSYSLPETVLKRVNVRNIRVFFTATNLFMLYSANKIYDPEQNIINSYPTMKTFSFGLNIGL
ncbi:MAG TPA: TonB-dependent receptor [Arachidicoccus sp.]|nr:TonB-dependent receptor [Arachidicoccus sp.]